MIREYASPADVELITAHAITAAGLEAAPPPVPSGLTAPRAVVWRTGGHRIALVIDRSIVSVDVYAPTWGAAMDACARAVAAVQDMAGRIIDGVQTGGVWIITLPYTNPDPDHPTIPRVTFSAEIITKATVTREIGE